MIGFAIFVLIADREFYQVVFNYLLYTKADSDD